HYYGGYTPWWYRRFLMAAGFEQIEIEANEGSFRFFGQESLR
ncbi:MAG TPA: SAM-dependent methyltransferase, partial [Nitrospira sp.]|nr:SAM-dependent methyltransferase [Nitrospira sp.]